MKQSNKRKYPNIGVNDVKIYTKGEGKYISRKEHNSRWSDNTYKVLMKGRDIMSNTYYKLEGLTKEYLRHEILLINE